MSDFRRTPNSIEEPKAAITEGVVDSDETPKKRKDKPRCLETLFKCFGRPFSKSESRKHKADRGKLQTSSANQSKFDQIAGMNTTVLVIIFTFAETSIKKL